MISFRLAKGIFKSSQSRKVTTWSHTSSNGKGQLEAKEVTAVLHLDLENQAQL